MQRRLALSCLLAMLIFGFGFQLAAADKGDGEDSKEALRALQEFIGEWNGVGGPDKAKVDPRDPIWKEKINWGWRFKGDDAWLTFDVKDGKYLKGGEVRFLPEKKKYQVTAVSKSGEKSIYEGEIKSEVLRVERTDPKTKEVQRLEMNTAGDGVRLIVRYSRKPSGTTIFKKEYMVAATKEGESLGAAEKKNICVVSGGVGTTPVSFKGETFYVCCSGCADAFKENPEKYVKEFKAKKGKK